MAQERNKLRAQLRHSARDSYRAATTPGPVVEAGLIGSAARAIVKATSRGKYPKRAAKGSSVEDKIAYTDARRKALQAARDKSKAKAEAKKTKRRTKYSTKRDAALARKDERLAKAKEDAARAQRVKDADDWVNLTGKYAMPKKSPARKRDTATWESTQKAKDAREAARAYEKKEAAAARRKAAQQRNSSGSGSIGDPRSQRYRDQFGNWGWR